MKKKKIDGAYCLGFSFKDLKTKDANFSYILLMRLLFSKII